jgi:predicted phosphohydrolase
LSDLHFGEFHRFPKITATDPIIEYPVFEKIKHYLDAEVERKIGVLVITGDLVSKGSEKDFRFVERFIENIRLYLNIEKNKVIIIPGNHDMWTADVPETELLEFKHEQAFRDFIRLYYSDGTNTIEKIHRFITPAGWNLNIIGLHSVHCRQVITREYGYIGNSADYLFEKITEENGERSTAQLTSDRILNLALMHHHIISPPFILKPDGERPLSVTLDAGSLINLFCNAKIRFVIHGHNHFPYIGTVQSSNVKGEWKLDQFPLNIICGGSCGVKEAYLRDEFKHNTFGIYTPLETGLHIDVVKYNPTEEPERYAHYLIPY